MSIHGWRITEMSIVKRSGRPSDSRRMPFASFSVRPMPSSISLALAMSKVVNWVAISSSKSGDFGPLDDLVGPALAEPDELDHLVAVDRGRERLAEGLVLEELAHDRILVGHVERDDHQVGAVRQHLVEVVAAGLLALSKKVPLFSGVVTKPT